DREADLVRRGRLTDRETLGEVVQADAGGDEDGEPACRRKADEMVLVLELRGGGCPGAEERATAPALHPDVVVDEGHQADEEAGDEQEGEPGEAAVVAGFERGLDR